MLQWIHREDRELTEVENFINKFMLNIAKTAEELEILRRQFRSGYCWYFAHMLKDAFNRGTVVLAAPFGHICWQDENKMVYDIEGEYTGEASYFIPEEFAEKVFPGSMLDFKHIKDDYLPLSKSQCISLMKIYCAAESIKYSKLAEKYLIDNETSLICDQDEMDVERI